MQGTVLIARKLLNVDGKTRDVGQLVPEAETWPNLHVYIEGGHVERVEGSYEPGVVAPVPDATAAANVAATVQPAAQPVASEAVPGESHPSTTPATTEAPAPVAPAAPQGGGASKRGRARGGR